MKRAGFRRPSSLTAFEGARSGREAPEGTPNVSLTKTLQRAIPELAHTLARHAEHRANLLQRVLTSAFESEVETEDLRVTRWQRAESLLDLVGEEAVHRFLFGIRHLVSHEALDERAIAFWIHRRIEAHIARVQRGERLHDVDRQAGELRQLLRAGLAVQLLAENLGRLDDARQICGAIERNANGAALACERRKDRLTNPPDRV